MGVQATPLRESPPKPSALTFEAAFVTRAVPRARVDQLSTSLLGFLRSHLLRKYTGQSSRIRSHIVLGGGGGSDGIHEKVNAVVLGSETITAPWGADRLIRITEGVISAMHPRAFDSVPRTHCPTVHQYGGIHGSGVGSRS